MPLTILPVTLITAGALALLNLWLTWRVGQVRHSEKVSVGDGGNERVVRRMRAHANFAENAPLALILIGLVEFSAGTSPWLWLIAVVLIVGRIVHGFGMDGWMAGRAGGTAATMAVQLVLAVWAIAIPLVHHHAAGRPDTTEIVTPNG